MDLAPACQHIIKKSTPYSHREHGTSLDTLEVPVLLGHQINLRLRPSPSNRSHLWFRRNTRFIYNSSVDLGPCEPTRGFPFGYLPVDSIYGRLFYLPESLHKALQQDDQPIPSIFQTRQPRPHRIHIARITGVVDPNGKRPPTNPNLPAKRTKKERRSTASIFFGKLAGTKGKRFFRSWISSNPKHNPNNTTTTQSSSPEREERPYQARSNPRRPVSWAPGGTGSRSTSAAPGERSSRSSGEQFRARFVKRHTSAASTMRQGMRHSVAGPIGSIVPQNIIINEDSNSSSPSLEILPQTGQKIPEEKPIACGNGVAVSIALAEPYLFLQGFEQGDLQANRSTAMLRGSLHLKITKPTKLKTVTLKFRGKATTKWPEGIPPRKAEFEEVNEIMAHTWPFFNSQFPTAEHSTGADHVELQQTQFPEPSKRVSLDVTSILRLNQNTLSKEDKRLSLQSNYSRSFGQGDQVPGASVAQKGYRTFQPGDYLYNFELPLDCHLPETLNVELGTVKYELEATIERQGTFKSNLVGVKEIHLIRTPAEGSLETVEPIAISRKWDDQLHYDIVISGKSFPLGAQIPIAFKLTPLAKVQCHRVKVYVTESAEYFCANKRVHRTEPARRMLLFEKRADSAPVSTFPGSSMRIVSGGGIAYDQRAAAARGDTIIGNPNNLLGHLDAGDRTIGPTEMEFNVQLPTCADLEKRDKASRLHFDTTYTNVQVHHWIKIVLRLSRPDANDPSKRRHFEISIDSPFHILSCRATQANTSLPAYSSPESPQHTHRLYECGCPGAPVRRNSPTSFVPTLNSFASASSNSPTSERTSRDFGSGSVLQPPPAAHLGGDGSVQRPVSPNTAAVAPRPMHIIRAPSYNPPPFDEEEPPPPLMTPPPQYDDIASPTTGLADYFARFGVAYATEGVETEVAEASSSAASTLNVEEEPEGMTTPTNRRSVNLQRPDIPQAPPAQPLAGQVGNWI